MAHNPPPTPRLTAPYLSHFPSQTVRLIGKVVQLRGETAVVDAGGEINVLLNRVRLSFSLSLRPSPQVPVRAFFLPGIGVSQGGPDSRVVCGKGQSSHPRQRGGDRGEGSGGLEREGFDGDGLWGEFG